MCVGLRERGYSASFTKVTRDSFSFARLKATGLISIDRTLHAFWKFGFRTVTVGKFEKLFNDKNSFERKY